MMELGTAKYLSHEDACDTDDRTSFLPNQKGDGDNEITEESTAVNRGKRPTLSIGIPSRNLQASSTNFVRINMPLTPGSASAKPGGLPTFSPTSANTPTPACIHVSPGPSSFKGRSSMKKFLPKLSFKNQSLASENEKVGFQAPEASSAEIYQKPSILRSLSFTKIFSPTVRRTSSLPVPTFAHVHDSSSHGNSIAESPPLAREEVRQCIPRSLSVPLNTKSRNIKRMNSLGAGFRVIPSPRVKDISGVITNVDSENKGDGEDIPEEEAVCRICMIELSEGSDTFKLECSCKGALALAHQECALKWFSIKGNITCEVCKQDVQNLPVTLLRIQNVQTADLHTGRRSHETATHRYSWQDMPVLVIISMLAYFCFLEQLLVGDNGSEALIISLPFSCILGLLASLTSTSMVGKWYIWIYATVQFLLVVLFAHLFYIYLHMRPVMSIVLAMFAGFGVSMSVSSFIVKLLRWRRRWLLWSLNRRSTQEMPPTTQPVTVAHQPQLHTSSLHQANTGTPIVSPV